MTHWLLLFATGIGLTTGWTAHESLVGMRNTVEDVVLPGPKLEVKPIEALKSPVVVRLVSVHPHGSDHRYVFEYYALEEGSFDLLDFLQPSDGSPLGALPPIPLLVSSTLREGQRPPQVQRTNRLPTLGGYGLLSKLALAVWILGLFFLLFFRKRQQSLSLDTGQEVTFEERLRPKVEEALAGNLDSSGYAELERMLLTFWRRRLDLAMTDSGEAMRTLRNHEEAGPLILQLEAWLHRPKPPEDVDLEALLEPYRR
ncbi:MAG: hypothetical protein AAF191_21425 [Verrucomicrobiota bacterium]